MTTNTENREIGILVLLRQKALDDDSVMEAITRQMHESRDRAFTEQGLVLVPESERIEDDIFPEDRWCYTRDNDTKEKTDCPLNGEAHRHRVVVWDGLPA